MLSVVYIYTVSNVAENSLECALVTKTVQRLFFFFVMEELN